MADLPIVQPIQQPLAELERMLIDDNIRASGYDPVVLRQRDDELARQVFARASRDASARLCEVESRAHYIQALRGEV